MHRLTVPVPETNVVMLRVVCDSHAHRLAAKGTWDFALGERAYKGVPVNLKPATAGTRSCDLC